LFTAIRFFFLFTCDSDTGAQVGIFCFCQCVITSFSINIATVVDS